jgi:hypothetical protein
LKEKTPEHGGGKASEGRSPGAAKSSPSRRISVSGRLAFEFGWLPSLDARSLHRWHLEGCTWGIIDGYLDWRSDFDCFSVRSYPIR